jgi:hypothetical protein
MDRLEPVDGFIFSITAPGAGFAEGIARRPPPGLGSAHV